MAKPTDKQILDRAHLLWKQNGKPDGREDEFWYQAERQSEAEERGDPPKEIPEDI